MNRRLLVIGLVTAAFTIGLATAYVSTPSGEKCGEIEKQFENNESFAGTMSCYPPGVIQVNLSEDVSENSDLRCVCRGVWGGEVHLFPISFSK